MNDLSGLIFVALAVAWAVYLIPKALKHHDEVVRSRSIDRFSSRMRVLAHREPVSRRAARLVVAPARATASIVTTKPVTQPAPVAGPVPSEAEQRRAQRAATRSATKRRQRVLAVLLLANLTVVSLAAAGVVAWPWVAIPGALLVGWLVTCRLMVRKEAAWTPVTEVPVDEERSAVTPIVPVPVATVAEAESDDTGQVPVVTEPGLWDPLPVTLPTYVGKPTAQRTVRTIDLDSTGVWTSGRTAADSKIAREAEAAGKSARTGDEAEGDRAVGS